MRQLPPLSGLQAFEAAARHLSFTEAAKELNCTQAAISQRVRALEHYLSRRLFLRKSNGLELSEAGEAYLPGVAEALNVAAAATAGLRGRHIPRRVTLSAPVSFLTLWLTPRLERLLSAHDDVELRLNSAIWNDPNAELADIVVEIRDEAELEKGTHHLPPERLCLVGSPAIAGELAATPIAQSLARWRRIEIQGRHDLWRRWAEGLGVEAPAPASPLKVDNAVTALEAAASGLGLAVAYGSYCDAYVASGRVFPLPEAGTVTRLCFAIVSGPRQPAWHPAHRLFASLADAFGAPG